MLGEENGEDEIVESGVEHSPTTVGKLGQERGKGKGVYHMLHLQSPNFVPCKSRATNQY